MTNSNKNESRGTQSYRNQSEEAKHDHEVAGEQESPNLRDAQELGYTDQAGTAVGFSKKDRTGSPTGAYTDVGAGRSSAVHKSSQDDEPEKDNRQLERNPEPGGDL